MSFKHKFSLLLASVMLITSVGCSDFINGQESKEEELHFSNDKLVCLKDVPASLKRFTNGDADKKEITENVDCLRKALVYFQKKTYGAQSNAYTVEEMRRFFSKYFLKENVVTPEFAQELMKIKKALLGGSSNNLTKDEITRLVDVLAILRDEAVELAPHIKLLLLVIPSNQANWQQVSAATEQMRIGLQHLLEKTELSHSDYSFEDAKRALRGFKVFIKEKETETRVTQWLPVVEVVKNVLMGQEAQLATYTQWKGSLNSLVDLYGLFLKYHYVIHNFDTSNEAKVREVSQFIGQAIDLIDGCPQIITRGMIPLQDIDSLIETVLDLPGVKKIVDIRPISIETLYRAAILRLLEPGRNGDSRGILGLEKKHIVALRREYNVWKMMQTFVDSQIADGRSTVAPLTPKELKINYANYKIMDIMSSRLSTDPYEQTALNNAWADFGEILDSDHLITYNRNGRLMEVNSSLPVTTDWKSLTKSNLMRAMSRALMLAYGKDTSGRLSKATILKDGLITWYEDFKELMYDLKAFDRRTGNTAERSFSEANFFTFSGNGDDYMNQKETFEFISLLFSAGLSSSDSIYKNMVAEGCVDSQSNHGLDPLGFHYMGDVCFERRFRTHFSEYFDNLPEMVKYVGKMNDVEWKEFYSTLRFLARVSDKEDQGVVEVANVRTMVTIVHYVESIMVTYDKNRNQFLSLDEVYDASPRFLPYLKQAKKDIPFDTLLNQGFAYLVFYGKEGSATDLAWFQAQKMWLKEAPRMNLLRVIKVMKVRDNAVKERKRLVAIKPAAK